MWYPCSEYAHMNFDLEGPAKKKQLSTCTFIINKRFKHHYEDFLKLLLAICHYSGNLASDALGRHEMHGVPIGLFWGGVDALWLRKQME